MKLGWTTLRLNDTKQNPRDHCKAITLRSGKEVESSGQKKKKGKEAAIEVEVERDFEEVRLVEAGPTHCRESPIHCSEGSKSRGISFLDNPPIISPPIALSTKVSKEEA